jgi:outer membrane protein TolC
VRDSAIFLQSLPQQVSSGIPSQLLQNRPDIRQAERELSAAQFDVQVARKEFYPSFEISSVLGFNAFRPSYLVKFPESLIFSLAGDLAGPLINKNAIQAQFSTATALQLQALYNYEKSVLNGYIEVSTGLANISNLQNAYVLKSKQVEALLHSVDIANELFRADRADYFEVLMTQRDMLGARLDLNETRLSQWQAITNIYRSLGGGWR